MDWKRLSKEELIDHIKVQEKIINGRNKILDLLPCPIHGQCVPYVINWIKERKK